MELGNLHNIILEYIENNSANKNGSVASGIAHCLHEELCVYYDSINKLQKEVFISTVIHNNYKMCIYKILFYYGMDRGSCQKLQTGLVGLDLK